METILFEVFKIAGYTAVVVMSNALIAKRMTERIADKDKTHTDGFAAQNESYVKSISDIAKSFTDVMDRQTVARNAEMAKTLETIQLIQFEMGRKTAVLTRLMEAQEANNERLIKLESEIQNHYAEIKAKQSQIDADIKTHFAQLALQINNFLPR